MQMLHPAAPAFIILGVVSLACAGLSSEPTSTAPARPTATAPATATARVPTPTAGPTEPEAPRACLDAQELAAALDPTAPVDEAVADYLAAGGSPDELEALLGELCPEVWGAPAEPLRYELTRHDIDGDGKDDVLFTATASLGGGAGESYASAYLQSGEAYEWHQLYRRAGFGSGAEGLYSGGGARIVAVGDFNRNGRAEVALHVRWPDYGQVSIAEWDGQGFASRVRRTSELTFEEVEYIALGRQTVEVADETGAGRQDLVLVGKLDGAGEPITGPLQRREIWSWSGQLYEQAGAKYRPEPRYRIEALYLGELAWAASELDQALTFYQQAVFDEALLGWQPGFTPDGAAPPDPDPAERERINAFGRFRILMVHAARGGMTPEAEIVYQSILERVDPDAAGGPYRELAGVFWAALEPQGGSIWTACQAAADHAAAHPDEILKPLGSGYYGSFGRMFEPAHLCPPPSLD